MVFGIISNKPPTPIMVEKMLLFLIVADMFSHTATVIKSTEDKSDGASLIIKAVLGYSLGQNNSAMPIYAMFDDSYWFRVNMINPIIV